MSTLNSLGVNSCKLVILGDFLQRNGDYNYRNAIFSTFPPENEFLQKFCTINAHNNEEFTIKPSEKKIYVKFVEGFSGLFCISTVLNIRKNCCHICITWQQFGGKNFSVFFVVSIIKSHKQMLKCFLQMIFFMSLTNEWKKHNIKFVYRECFEETLLTNNKITS